MSGHKCVSEMDKYMGTNKMIRHNQDNDDDNSVSMGTSK